MFAPNSSPISFDSVSSAYSSSAGLNSQSSAALQPGLLPGLRGMFQQFGQVFRSSSSSSSGSIQSTGTPASQDQMSGSIPVVPQGPTRNVPIMPQGPTRNVPIVPQGPTRNVPDPIVPQGPTREVPIVPQGPTRNVPFVQSPDTIHRGESLVSPLDDTMSGANNIGYLYGSRSLSDFVGSNDTQDYYRVSVGTNSQINLTITGLSADADVELLNSVGTTIARSAYANTHDESINLSNLAEGEYYVRVYSYQGLNNTNYTLNLTVS